MVGITLSSEQILHAPPEVRRWLEQQIAGTLGLFPAAPELQVPTRHLVGCSPGEAQAILSLIQGFLPVTAVFFELAREPAAMPRQGLRALRLDDIGLHVHLQNTDQVCACLDAIDKALQRATGRPDAAVTVLDGAGHCLIADATAKSILSLWQEIVAARGLAAPDLAPAEDGPAQSVPSAPTASPVRTMSAPPFTIPGQAG